MTPSDPIDTRDVALAIRVAARRAVHTALRRGILIRPNACERCGHAPARGKNGKVLIDAHHHNGYDVPLDVVWLCQRCHQLEHARRHGIQHTDDIKEQISESLKQAYAEGRHTRPNNFGDQNPFYGRHHTPETRAKISAARRAMKK